MRFPKLAVLSILCACSALSVHAADETAWRFDLPPVAEPTIPDRAVGVADFGGVPDGRTLNTDAIANAIDAVTAQGGGRVVFPAGIWLTGPIALKSNLELHLEEGALLRFSPDIDLYPRVDAEIKGETAQFVMSPLWGVDLENLAITGRGVIDGSGEAWRPVKKFKLTERHWNELLAMGGELSPDGEMWWPSAAVRAKGRPTLLKLIQCKRILLEGVTFQNSPAWNLHPLLCEDLTARNITVRNPWWSQNGDGLNPESCRNVVIRDSRFDVGDDAITLKSGINERGRRRGVPTENVLVENCIVYHGHGGFVVGSEMSGGVRNIRVNNCVFMGTDVGLRFKSTRGRGGVVENIDIRNIRMTDIPTDAIRFNMYYGGNAPTEGEDGAPTTTEAAPPVDEGTPQFRNVWIENVTCRGAGRAVLLQGLPEMPIRGILLKSVSITADNGIDCMDAENITLHDVEIANRKGPVMRVFDSRQVAIDGLTYPNGAETMLALHGEKNAAIVVGGTDTSAAKQAVTAADGADRNAVTIR
jgi:polygalacturonase